MPKRVVASDRLMQPIAHFSHGVRVGTTVHLGAAGESMRRVDWPGRPWGWGT